MPKSRTEALVGTILGLFVVAILNLPIATEADEPAQLGWLQWGGPQGEFHAPAGEIAATWPDEGPPILWRRSLGEGQSAVLFEGGRLYTMYRKGPDEVVICLDATNGETLWEEAYEAEYEGLTQYGTGPRSTPLLAGDRLFTIGVMGRMTALDKRDGKILWTRELWGEELGGNRLGHGYSSSPLAYGREVIVPVGGEGASVVAFDQASGEIRWKAHSFRNSYSSPRLETIAGEQQLLFMAEELVALDPSNGDLRWSWPHANQWGHNITMPSVYGDTVFFSSPQAGARGLRIVSKGEGFEPEQIWSTRRVQFYHGTSVQQDDWVFGSTGTTAPSFLTAIHIPTGEVAWKQRGFTKANWVAADGKVLLLDDNGRLYLAKATPEELVVLAQFQLLGRYAWTVPTVVDRTLFARDDHEIVAVNLG